MSRSIIFENQEQMQCVNFGFDDFFPSARNELDTCSLNQKLSDKYDLAVKPYIPYKSLLQCHFWPPRGVFGF